MEWERLEEENANQYCWFQEFLQHDDYSLKKFHEKISGESEESKKKTKKTPTYKTIVRWSSINKWMKRKKAYSIYKAEQQRHRLEEADYKNKELINQKKNLLITKALEKVEEEFNKGTLSGYQFSNWVNGVSKLLDDNRIDIGKPTEISQNKSEVHVEQELDVKSIFEQVDKELGDIKEKKS